MYRVSVVTYAPVSVSPNPKVFKKNGSKKLFQVPAPVIAAPANVSQHAALSKQFFGKNCRGRYKKIGGLATPHFSEMEGGQPLRYLDFIPEACEIQNSRNPYFMQSFYSLKSPSNISK